jgi:hypothetical protein
VEMVKVTGMKAAAVNRSRGPINARC